jgi:hypothetical protein
MSIDEDIEYCPKILLDLGLVLLVIQITLVILLEGFLVRLILIRETRFFLELCKVRSFSKE